MDKSKIIDNLPNEEEIKEKITELKIPALMGFEINLITKAIYKRIMGVEDVK